MFEKLELNLAKASDEISQIIAGLEKNGTNGTNQRIPVNSKMIQKPEKIKSGSLITENSNCTPVEKQVLEIIERAFD